MRQLPLPGLLDASEAADALALLSGEVVGMLHAAYSMIGDFVALPDWRPGVRGLAKRMREVAGMMDDLLREEKVDLSNPPLPQQKGGGR